MNDFLTISEYKYRLSKRKDGSLLPISNDIFNSVGLNGLLIEPDGIEEFFALWDTVPDNAVKYVCFICDINKRKARRLLKRFFVVELGIRLTIGKDFFQKREDYGFFSVYIGQLYDYYFSALDTLKMLKEEGFKLELTDFAIQPPDDVNKQIF